MSRRLPIAVCLSLSLLLAFALLSGGAAAAGGATAVGSLNCGPVQYEGAGTADALIVSDLPLRRRLAAALAADERRRSNWCSKGAGWKAGSTTVGFQACDDSSPKTGLWTKAICQANAKAYAADPSVLAVIGTYNSGCAEVEIPILGKAPGGGVAMVSPGNTAICLTESSPECTGGTPGSLYPKAHNYARVVPNDAYQGAGPGELRQGRRGEERLRPLRRRRPDQPRPGEHLPRRRRRRPGSRWSASPPGTRRPRTTRR